ncbi:NADH:ubiquinone oxidoreductase [Photobacterium sp. SP02]|uniref:NADH:ubiquinone oxidoreductase n=1 Tax=Photobacterium sp. SP02 TaxID=3032280 RepID=UPI003144DA9E
MKFLIILAVSVVAGVFSGEHLHSFMAGFGIASLAVGTAYWLAFRATRYPQLAFMLLLTGLMAKMGVTVAGVMWGLENQVINSPLVFALSYLFFSIVATYGYFKLREYQLTRLETLKLANA